MIPTVTFDSSLKNDPPPHPGDDHSTKHAKFEEANIMEVANPLDSPPVDPLVEPTPHIPSFKDKLLNSEPRPNDEEDEELILQQGDVSIGLKGNIPTVDFATHVLESLNQKMGLAVVVKLMGRKVGYRQLQTQLQYMWKPVGQLKIIDLDDDRFLVRFKDDMDYRNALLNVTGWIILPKLPARYYHKSIIRSIGSVFGEVIRVDYNTNSGDIGKFARLAVSIDLMKPLISKIQVDDDIIFVEYEGLPTICFHCGRYGHLQVSCPEIKPTQLEAPPAAPCPLLHTVREPLLATQDHDSVNFGEWMMVQRRPRRTIDRTDKKTTTIGGKILASKSRYEVLNEVELLEEDR
ncbi:hypothetical protein K1719_026008 [Acacia pycnantha]|nr:hypothetical protein K1719_026008 [Acacia pycnantha]